jgi:hypothetical protein
MISCKYGRPLCSAYLKGMPGAIEMFRTPYRINLGFGAILITAALLLSSTAGSITDDLQGYKPIYSLGSGKDDWWIKYPDQSQYPDQRPRAGLPVNHLPWVIEALQNKPVVILDHSENCKACKVQMRDLDKVLDIYGKDVIYYNITAMADGSGDQRAFEVLDTYCLNAAKPTVPTTVVLTLLSGADGNVEIGWHTMDDAMGEQIVTAYIKDAIFYYRQNSANWNK